MNLSEFKSWFEGFTENLDGPPGEKAWKKIQAKVKQIVDAPPTSYPVYVDRWVRPYWDRYWGPYYGGLAYQNGLNSTGASLQAQSFLGMQGDGGYAQSWNSSDAFKDLGRAEALSLSA